MISIHRAGENFMFPYQGIALAMSKDSESDAL